MAMEGNIDGEGNSDGARILNDNSDGDRESKQ